MHIRLIGKEVVRQDIENVFFGSFSINFWREISTFEVKTEYACIQDKKKYPKMPQNVSFRYTASQRPFLIFKGRQEIQKRNTKENKNTA